MSKKSWIILGIALAVIIAGLLVIKYASWGALILGGVSYVAGIASYWLVNKFDIKPKE